MSWMWDRSLGAERRCSGLGTLPCRTLQGATSGLPDQLWGLEKWFHMLETVGPGEHRQAEFPGAQ